MYRLSLTPTSLARLASLRRSYTSSPSKKPPPPPPAGTILHRTEPAYMRYGGLVVLLQSAGLIGVCATLPLDSTSVETERPKRLLYTAAAASMGAVAVGIVRRLTRGRLVSLRVTDAGVAQALARRWWDPTGALVVAAAAPAAAGGVRLSAARLAEVARDRQRAREGGGRRRQARANEGVLAIRVGGEEGEMFSVDARECEVFDERALRAMAVDVDGERETKDALGK